MMKVVLRSLALVVAVGLLAGCVNKDKQAACPGMVALADASTLHVFRAGAPADPSNVLYTVQIARVHGICEISKRSHEVDADIDVYLRATRAPNGQPAQYNVAYFVAVTQGDRVVNKFPFTAQISFAPGEAVAEVTETAPTTEISLEEGKHAWDYQVLVGMPLTKGDLDYNRTIGRYGQ
jgi:hypothetical protein